MRDHPRPRPLRRVTAGFSIAFRSLRSRNYRLFWFGQLVSMVGTWAGEVALAWLVLSITDSPALLGLSVTIRFLPALILSPVGGVLADRIVKRRLLILIQVMQVSVALALALLTSTGLVGIASIFVLAALRGVGDSLDTPAKQAFVLDMVDPDEVSNAVALNSLQFNVARIVGPVVGAALIGTIGIAACFYFNAAAALVVIGLLLALRTSQMHPAPTVTGKPMVSQLREVASFCYRTPDIMLIFLLVFAIATFGYNFMTVLPLLAKYVLDSGSAGLGALTASLGVGSMLAAVWMAYRGAPTRRLLVGASCGFSILLVLMGLSARQEITMGVLVVLGICGILFSTTANTRLQLLSPSSLRGRVMGLYTWLFMGMAPVGSMLVGWLAQWSGTQPMVLETAGICALGVAAALWYARRNRNRMVATLKELPLRGVGEEEAASADSRR
jgi:MFS family permease